MRHCKDFGGATGTARGLESGDIIHRAIALTERRFANVSNSAHGAYPNVFKNLPSDKLRNTLDVALKPASELSGIHTL